MKAAHMHILVLAAAAAAAEECHHKTYSSAENWQIVFFLFSRKRDVNYWRGFVILLLYNVPCMYFRTLIIRDSLMDKLVCMYVCMVVY